MADKPTETHDGAAPVAASEPAPAPEPTKTGEPELSAKEDEPKPEPQGEGDQADEEAKKPDDAQKSADDAPEKSQPEQDKPAADADVEMKDAAEDAAPEAEAEAPATEAAAETPAPKPKGGNRRKSTAGESKGKALNKKGSKARLTHTDAKPGDHFLVKLKGFPAWPAVICDETMLPAALLNSRPVSAARPDGTYSEAYADGGKRVHDRSFPVMYLYTNEFGWVQNTALSELTPEKAKDSITDKMRKDLRSAMELAAEDHPIDYYKNILTKFQEEQIAQEEARKEAAATPKKSKKGKGKGKAASEDEDAEMEDVDAAPKSAKSKKRKAEDDTATPQRTDSVKKPKIKLNTTSTPKAANGAATPKSAGASASKAAKPKAKKAKEGADKKEAPKEAKMTPEERHARKEKEVLYLRHKLQRGLLTREQQPREDEMKAMSDFITMLENFVDLEVSIIRATKINKVLKAILKLDSIPKEEDFQFKKRSQTLLDKWNKLLAGDGSAPAPAPTNGVNGGAQEKKSEANGVKEESAEAKKAEPEQEKTSEPKQSEEKAVSDAGADKPAAETTDEKGDKEEKAAAETAPASEPVAAEN